MTFNQGGDYTVTFVSTNSFIPLNCTAPISIGGSYTIHALNNNDPEINGEQIVTEENEPITVCLDFIDPDEMDTYTASLCGDPSNGTATTTLNQATGEICITYTPNTDYSGTDELCVKVCDDLMLVTVSRCLYWLCQRRSHVHQTSHQS